MPIVVIFLSKSQILKINRPYTVIILRACFSVFLCVFTAKEAAQQEAQSDNKV